MIRTRRSRAVFVVLVYLLAVGLAWSATHTSLARSTPTSTPTLLMAPVVAEWTIYNPSGVFTGFDSIWVPGHHKLETTRIDPNTNKVVAVIEGTGDHSEFALAVDDVLWVSGQADDTTWIDPVTNTVSTSMAAVPGTHFGMAFGFDSLWVIASGNFLDRIDPATGKIIASIKYSPQDFEEITSGVQINGGAVWVTREDGQELVKIDPATNEVVSTTPFATLIDQANAQKSVPQGKGTDSLWLRSGPDESPALLRVDPVTEVGLAFLPVTTEQMYHCCAVTDEYVWLGGHNGLISRINIATNQIDAFYDSGAGNINSIAIAFGSVWLEKYDRNLVQRLEIAP